MPRASRAPGPASSARRSSLRVPSCRSSRLHSTCGSSRAARRRPVRRWRSCCSRARRRCAARRHGADRSLRGRAPAWGCGSWTRRSHRRNSDVFDYVRPGRAADYPLRGAARCRRSSRWPTMRGWVPGAAKSAALLLLILLVAGGAGVRPRVATMSLLPVARRSPRWRGPRSGTPTARPSLFAPETYAQPLMGPFSSSAGALLLTGVVVFVVACVLWHRGFRPSWPGRIVERVISALARAVQFSRRLPAASRRPRTVWR